MAGEQSSINPWVRANLEQPSPETEVLIPEALKGVYAEILGRLAAAKATANEALADMYLAEQDRQKFFEGLAYGAT